MICSAYFDSTKDDVPDQLKCLLDFCKSNRYEILIVCDANAHHAVWNSRDTTDRGKMVFEILLSYNLQVLNNGDKPTFRNILD